MAEHGDRAHEKLCPVIHHTSSIHGTALQLDNLLEHLARQADSNPLEASGAAIVDCSNLIPIAPVPALCSLWVTRVSTPSVFSLTCVGEHIRNQLREKRGKIVISIFNDTGGYGKFGEALAAGTYMVVFKKIDIEKLQCVPINFSAREKKAMKEYLSQCQSSSNENEKSETQA